MDYQYIEKMDEKAQRNVASLFQALHKSDLPPSLVTQVKDSAEDLSYLFKSTTDPDAFVSRLARVTPSDQLVGDLAADHAYKYMNSSPEERLKRFQEILKKLQDKAARSATRLKDETKDLIRTIAEIRALNELIDNQQQTVADVKQAKAKTLAAKVNLSEAKRTLKESKYAESQARLQAPPAPLGLAEPAPPALEAPRKSRKTKKDKHKNRQPSPSSSSSDSDVASMDDDDEDRLPVAVLKPPMRAR